MNCEHCRETADRYAVASDEERRQVHAHMSECGECRDYFDGFRRTTAAFEHLGNIEGAQARIRIRGDLERRADRSRRQAQWAMVGAVIAALAAFWFIAKAEPFGYFALLGTSIAMGWAVWRSRRQARRFAEACEDTQMLTRWRGDVQQELHEVTIVGPLIAVAFAILSTIVIVRFGIVSLRGLIYGGTCMAIIAYVARQWVVVRPRLRSEMALVDEDESAA